MCHFSTCSARASETYTRNKPIDFAGPHPLTVPSVASSTGKTIFFSRNLEKKNIFLYV